MGWSLGFDHSWNRDIGYSVTAYCDHPDCNIEIDRGLSYVCGGDPYGGDFGCGLFFCDEHLQHVITLTGENNEKLEVGCQLCERCAENQDPFEAKQDHPEWIREKEMEREK